MIDQNELLDLIERASKYGEIEVDWKDGTTSTVRLCDWRLVSVGPYNHQNSNQSRIEVI